MKNDLVLDSFAESNFGRVPKTLRFRTEPATMSILDCWCTAYTQNYIIAPNEDNISFFRTNIPVQKILVYVAQYPHIYIVITFSLPPSYI